MEPAATGPRWNGDTRGHGVDDGTWIAPDVEALLTALGAAGWVAEDPEEHLQPYLRHARDAVDSPWALHEAALAGPVFAVTLEWMPPKGGPAANLRRLRADAFALLGSVAESTTFARQRITEDGVEFWSATGMLAGDTSFASHAHLLLLRIVDPAARALHSSQQ